jgi:hypothetical protein
MTRPDTPATLWQTLTHAGLVQGEMPGHPAEDADDETPVYVKAMLGVAAWISSLFLMVFVLVLFELEGRNNATPRIALGVIACAAAAFYFRKARSSVFVEQIFFVLALAGQALVGFGLLETYRVDRGNFLAMALFEAVVVLAIAYRPNRFLSALAALVFLHYAASPFWSNFLLPLYLAALALALHYQWRAPKQLSMVALALSLTPFWADMNTGFLWRTIYVVEPDVPLWVWHAGLIAVWLGVVYALLQKTMSRPWASENAGIWLLALVLAAGTWLTPMALFALAVFFLGFAQRDKVLEGIGLIELLWVIGHYYYSLVDTLLFKSLTLAGLGAGLLLLYAASRYVWPAAGREEQA